MTGTAKELEWGTSASVDVLELVWPRGTPASNEFRPLVSEENRRQIWATLPRDYYTATWFSALSQPQLAPVAAGANDLAPAQPTPSLVAVKTAHGWVLEAQRTRGTASQAKPCVDPGWQAYLRRLATSNTPYRSTAERLANLWSLLTLRMDQEGYELPAPIALPDASTGAIHLAWNGLRHYLELELFANGTWEWFYRDRETADTDGGEPPNTGSVPEAFAARLKRISRPVRYTLGSLERADAL